MTSAVSPAAFLHLVIGYDGSPPARRALDAAVLLLDGRAGRIDIVYVALLSGVAAEPPAPVAPAEMELGLDDIERELHAQAAEQLRDRGPDWAFSRRQGNTAHELIAVADGLREADPGAFVAIVVGSSSQPIHRVAGSVAVGLSRHPPVPVMIVP
jgi:nucleotide-binding universal stress UspA family protein